jgi:hypothetical protein
VKIISCTATSSGVPFQKPADTGIDVLGVLRTTTIVPRGLPSRTEMLGVELDGAEVDVEIESNGFPNDGALGHPDG